MIFKKVLPELINGILTGLKELEIADSDRNEDQVTELNRGLKEIRSQFLYIVEAHRTKVSKVDEDAANELIEMITSAILSIFSKQISKVSVLVLCIQMIDIDIVFNDEK